MSEDSRDLERWLPVVGYEGFYEVSDLGRVRSLARRIKARHGTRVIRGAIKKLSFTSFGYRVATLSKENKPQSITVHRLVLEAFVGPCPEGKECRHLDGDKLNNRPSNLVWGTHSENIFDQVKHGTHTDANRQACPLGHLLVHPNLRAYHVRQGARGCLACSRARNRQHKAKRSGRPPIDFKAVADRYYGQLMGTIPPDPPAEPKTRCRRGHRYTPKTARVQPTGSYKCLTCKNDARRKQPKG